MIDPRAASEGWSNAPSITVALSKGRILAETLPLLRQLGLGPIEDPSASRRLILETAAADVRLLIVRAQDVPTYVEYGAADLGIAGRDVLMEQNGDGYYEPLDLGIAKCRLVVAGRPGLAPVSGRIRVATKYPVTARAWFTRKGHQVEVIKLYGSMELAPLVGLADRIVDLVDTGNTLRANGLVVLEEMATITSRVIVNRAAMKMKYQRITAVLDALAGITSAAQIPP